MSDFRRASRHAGLVSSEPSDDPPDPERGRTILPGDGRPARPPRGHPSAIVYLEPSHRRQVSPYSPEGEIQMMGDFATGLRRSGTVSRPMIIALVVIILLPIVVSLVAVLSTFW